MVKAPRPSITDQLAAIAFTSSRDHVVEASRGDAEAAREQAKETSRTPAKDRTPSNVIGASRDRAVTASRDHVVARKRENVTADGLKIRQRIEKPHVSLYAHPRVLKKLREIAVAEDCKPHDLYVQGLRLVLKAYGYDFDKLERGGE